MSVMLDAKRNRKEISMSANDKNVETKLQKTANVELASQPEYCCTNVIKEWILCEFLKI